MRKVTVIGHFGFGFECLDGQTIKTKIVTEELERQLGEELVSKIDTHGGAKVFLKAPFQVFRALRESKNVIILPAHNGLRVNAPLLVFERLFFKSRKIHYVVIGGWLPNFIQKRRLLRKCLKNFDGIYVETNTMKLALEEQGFNNVYVMPNCKNLRILEEHEMIYPEGIPYRLCTFSRVQKEKGIEDAFEAVKEVNTYFGKTVYSLDIYGQIDVNQQIWFDSLQNEFPAYVRYCGVAPYNESSEIIKNYFSLLFPTYYEGEGFAGTILDAYSAGVPVIASDWRYNKEIVNEKVGLVYRTKHNDELISILKQVAASPSLILRRKRRCLEEAKKYETTTVIHTLIENL